MDCKRGMASSKNTNNDADCVIEQVMTKRNKILLNTMELHFPINKVTAIMGPSGSGKSTLLSLLTDSVATNIRAIAYVSQALTQSSAFVPQDDRLHGFYTCESYLRHYSRLTGLQNSPDSNIRIEQLLKQLGLFEQKDTIVGDLFFQGLSGGQKRRLSIALEALSHPCNFVLDEPTSGLDAESALQIMEFLKSFAQESYGRRVILTIHQPSSFIWQTVDHVILLSKGKLMYNGPQAQIEDFFKWTGFPTPETWNPADWYISCVNDEFRSHQLSVTEWESKFNLWKQQQPSILGSPPIQEAPVQIIFTARSKSLLVSFELVHRYFLNLLFNPGILGTRIAMYGMLSLMVGALFWDLGHQHDLESVNSRSAVLFYCVAFFIFMSVAVLPFTVMERTIVDKEVQNGYYHPILYQVAQSISSIPGAAILAGLVSLIVITMTKFQDPGWYFVNMFLALVVAESLAQLVSHVVPHFIIGMALLSGIYGFFMLFQGFMLIPSNFPNWLEWLYYVGPHSYSWRSFMVTEFQGQTFTGSEVFPTGEAVLEYFEIADTNRRNDMFVLAGYAVFVHCMSFLVLTIRHSFLRGKVESPSDATLRKLNAKEPVPSCEIGKLDIDFQGPEFDRISL